MIMVVMSCKQLWLCKYLICRGHVYSSITYYISSVIYNLDVFSLCSVCACSIAIALVVLSLDMFLMLLLVVETEVLKPLMTIVQYSK